MASGKNEIFQNLGASNISLLIFQKSRGGKSSPGGGGGGVE